MEEDRKSVIEAICLNTLNLTTGWCSIETPVGFTGYEPKCHKLEEEDDVEHYLVAFQRFATTYRLVRELWAQKFAPLLMGEAKACSLCKHGSM